MPKKKTNPRKINAFYILPPSVTRLISKKKRLVDCPKTLTFDIIFGQIGLKNNVITNVISFKLLEND